MKSLNVKSAGELQSIYLSRGYTGIYFCSIEAAENDIEHYSLARKDEEITSDCFGGEIIDLNDERALEIMSDYLNTEQVVIHPLNQI